MDDLEFAILPDEKIKEHDLVAIELEVNKKKRKRMKAQRNGEMISPLATSTAAQSNRRPPNNNAFRGENEEADDADLERNMRDQLQVDQLVDNNAAMIANGARNNRREMSICCGLFRRRRNGHLDIICVKDLHQDFLYMLLFVSGITTCLAMYALYAA